MKHILGNVICSVWFAFFGAVYEHFSHEVYSYYMIYAFAIPLGMGALLYSIMALKRIQLDDMFLNLWNSAIATFTIGSIFKGVLDIYGTTNRMVTVYPVVGGILTLCALISLIRHSEKTKKQAE
ncbi:MAG: hypothetical protein IJ644_06895 [Oscillospiraceae bacterium]|nr:hypothetical protein [Oscillospiraceae bacterium]